MEKNNYRAKLKGADLIGKKVLILGESGSGKTKMAAKLVQELMILMNPKQITVIDLAPQRKGNVGGKLAEFVSLTDDVKYFSPEKVYTPRLAGTSPKEILHYAELNRKIMEPLLDNFIKDPTEALIINDVTLYLHAGELKKIMGCLKLTKTFLATAYYGSKLAEDLGSGISLRERRLTDKLATFMNSIVKID